MKRVLLIAYHFPPIRHSSGVHRTLNFARYLREHGWSPAVLTVTPRAYALTSDDQMAEIPSDVPVVRAFALDTARDLSVLGRYPQALATPDRWISWLPFALHAARKLVREYAPDVIWSTYPIATAHLIGARLHRATGLPWVADFRDSMMDPGYPADLRQRRVHARIERTVVAGCARAVFTTPGAMRMYAERYPQVAMDRWAVIANGYDEAGFPPLPLPGTRVRLGTDTQRVLLHSGILYPEERDPRPFFAALANLKGQGAITCRDLKIRLRATAHDAIFAPMLDDFDIADIVEFAPPMAYREALEEMTRADGLLLFQGASCNHQVPAKVYEYLRAQRPILALTPATGDTAGVLREAGADNLVEPDDPALIAAGLLAFIGGLASGSVHRATLTSAQRYSRANGARQLAGVLDAVVAQP